jgi:hypothetical protein
LLIRLLLSVVVIVCFAHVFWMILRDDPTTELPFRVEEARGPLGYVVRARADVPLSAPLIDGQIIDIAQMQPADRAALLFPGMTLPGTRLTLALRRDQQSWRTTVSTRVSPSPPTRLEQLERWTGAILVSFVLAIALLTLWRGRDGTGWGFFAFSGGVLLINGLGDFSWPPIEGFWMKQAITTIALLIINPSVYVMAESLVGSGLPRSRRGPLRLAVAGFALASALAALAYNVSLIYMSSPPIRSEWMHTASQVMSVAVILIPCLVLLSGYRRTAHENRLRIRWVLSSTALLVVARLALTYLSPAGQQILYVLFNTVLPGVGILGYLYAILRTRVVDVAFVIDRALVFSVITAILFGVFSLLEQALHRFAAGEQLSWILQALTAVLLAAALSPLHRLLDRGLERVFFHDLRETVAALRALAAESAFFEKEEVLLSRALKQLLQSCAAAAIYERNGVTYQRRQAHGSGWPEGVDVDDPLFVRLRSGREELDIKTVESALGAEGCAFPMTVGQTLTGAVICTPRDGEQLNREVRGAMAELARSIGTSLYLLRYREQARLIAQIAAGDVDQAVARSRAAALVAVV